MAPLRLPLGVPATLADVLRAVRDDARPFALTGDWAGSRAIVASEPRRVVEGPDALEVLVERDRGGEFVGGGWFGYLGFGLGAAIERLPPPPARPTPLPTASLGFYDHVFRQDSQGGWWFEALDDSARPRLDRIRERLTSEPRPHALTPLIADDAEHHLEAVAECVERIAAGELFQANVCLRLNARFTGSAADSFLDAAQRLEPKRGAFLDLGEAKVLSFSPELFLRREHDVVITSPIKGTGTDPEALADSAKDAAEHVMIVDLSRNDLGRVARYGTVSPLARRIERHPGLYHLVTDVIARTGATDAEIVRAAFPPGSVTGTPKIQALKVIASLEPTQREVYTGAIGFASPHAGLHLNVAIRTLEIKGDIAWMGCGGGIVADSDPRDELEEALTKARPIARALDSHAIRAWPRRPDPDQGLLETIAVRHGELIDAHAHLRRLEASAEALYGLEINVEPQPEIENGRLRIRVSPRGELAIEQREENAEPRPVILEPRALQGGLGAHKWLDRPGEPHWLVVDRDGTVLETATANVWILRDDELLTPPDDGRLLPGVTRRRLLELPSAREASLTLDDLHDAEAVLLTSSIRLVTPAGLETPTPRAIALARELRRHPAISRKTGSYIR